MGVYLDIVGIEWFFSLIYMDDLVVYEFVGWIFVVGFLRYLFYELDDEGYDVWKKFIGNGVDGVNGIFN